MKKPRKHFLEVYMAAAGRTEVPIDFHLWTAISIVAAALANRVYHEKTPGDKMYPNLYTVLIGPSGCGKGEAINLGLKLLKDLKEVNTYRGKCTGAALADGFGKDSFKLIGKKKVYESKSMFLITPELSMSIGEGTIASDFIKRMTELYTGGDYVFKEGTRTHGEQEFKNPNINWISGTTIQWLNESVPRSAIESGFLARTIPIECEYDTTKRVPRPIFPPDILEKREWLKKQIRRYIELQGRFEISNLAWETHDSWYNTRTAPRDTALLPSWRRADDLCLKLAMILCVMSGKDDLRVTQKIMARAIELTEEAQQSLPSLIKHASASTITKNLEIVHQFIASAAMRGIQRSILTKKCYNRGIDAKELEKHLGALVEARDIDIIKLGKAEGYRTIPKEAVFADKATRTRMRKEGEADDE